MESMLLEILDKPFYPNECGHPDDAYVGSFITVEIVNSQVIHENFDVYVFTTTGKNVQELCVRYGKEPHEYIAHGFVVDAIRDHLISNYKAIIEVLKKKGNIIWQKK